MGLDYSYVLVIEPSVQEQLLASVRRSGTMEQLPLFGTCVTLNFSLDDALLAYLVDIKSRDESAHGPGSIDENRDHNYFPTNTTGRVGCIYLESQLDGASELLYVSFTAATSQMSRLFQ